MFGVKFVWEKLRLDRYGIKSQPCKQNAFNFVSSEEGDVQNLKLTPVNC